MKKLLQPEYETFIPDFINMLFGENDSVALSHKGQTFENRHFTRQGAIDYLLSNRETPNLYFRASSHDGSGSYSKEHCIKANALFIDVDYGSKFHSRTQHFKNCDDALCYILTMPLRPSIVWHTGHGFQCAYLLKNPYMFRSGENIDAAAIAKYEQVSKKLAAMAMGDATFTVEHLYRVPLTLNQKTHDGRILPDVRGQLILREDLRRYDFAEIAEYLSSYGIEDLIDEKAPSEYISSSGRAFTYENLPQELRDEIEDNGGERSDRLFRVIGWMLRLGYDEDAIESAVKHGSSFCEKYGKRSGGLRAEVGKCVAKMQEGRYVYGGRTNTPIKIYNIPEDVHLSDCHDLEPTFSEKIERYASITNAAILPRVKDAARFHEHLFNTKTSGVIESCCGAGKSVWALCHIACHASPESRQVYVTETVEALCRAADTLEKLTEVPVGRVHGFNSGKCRELCGTEHDWRSCRRNNPQRPCNSCRAREQCSFFTRPEQEQRPILCMTHAGFIRAMEDDSELLNDANVIVDEGLSPFNSWVITKEQLKLLSQVQGALQQIFPWTSVACHSRLHGFGVNSSCSFASKHLIHRNENEMAALSELMGELRLSLQHGNAEFGENANPDAFPDMIANTVNFFRPGKRHDSRYAYIETSDGIECKRSSFDLGGGGRWRSLWMLNASASITPFQYPDDMTVYKCPDLKDNSNLVTVHVLRGNPTRSRQKNMVNLAYVPMAFCTTGHVHENVLVCLDKESERKGEIEKSVRGFYGQTVKITCLSRGRIKGENRAGHCTLVLLQGLATFTGVNDCALHACLQYRRTFNTIPDVYNENGAPNWPGGKMKVPAMRDYFALRSLDDIYQAIWRSGVRNDKAVEAIMVVPDPNWLVALYRTVMPRYTIGSACKLMSSGKDVVQVPGRDRKIVKSVGKMDDVMYGVGVCNCAAGDMMRKNKVAVALSYKGDNPRSVRKPKSAWEKNKQAIMKLLQGVFEEAAAKTLKRLPNS